MRLIHLYTHYRSLIDQRFGQPVLAPQLAAEALLLFTQRYRPGQVAAGIANIRLVAERGLQVIAIPTPTEIVDQVFL